MKINFIKYQEALYEYIKRVKQFNQLLVDKYELHDIPYNVSGKIFPKIGEISTEKGDKITYRFHGRGATFWQGGIEIYFSVDASSLENTIMISEGSFFVFLKTFWINYDEEHLLSEVMNGLKEKNNLLQKTTDNGVYYVNEEWYKRMNNTF